MNGYNVMKKQLIIVAVVIMICLVLVECRGNEQDNNSTKSLQGHDYSNEDADQTDTTGESNSATTSQNEVTNEQVSDEERVTDNAGSGTTISSHTQSDLNKTEQGIELPDHEWK